MTRPALALLLLASCASTSRSVVTSSASSAQDGATAAAVEVVQHLEQAPGRETVTVEEYALGGSSDAAPRAAEDAPQESAHHEHRVGNPVDAGVVTGPHLLRRTVTVKEIGAVTATTTEHAATATQSHAETHAAQVATLDKESHPALSCAALGALWPAAVLAAVGALIWWRLRR